MNINRNKTMAITIAVLLTLSITASMALLPNAAAHTPVWNIPTYAYINVSPNPVGEGQSVLVIMWLDKLFSPETLTSNGYKFHNFELTITAPDGTKIENTFSIIVDSTSAEDYSFTPNQAGTYTLNFTFPGQAFNQYDHPTVDAFGNPEQLINDTYLPSSATTTLTVQQTPVTLIPLPPLPTQYWTRPIYGENPNWSTISSNWLGEGSPVEPSFGSGDINAYSANSPIYLTAAGLNVFPGDAIGPLTSHVMWTKPIQSGGVVGGNNFAIQGDTYFEGSAYINRFTNPIIVDGMLFYQAPLNYNSEAGSPPQISGTFCVNLQTGQQIWESNAVPAGQLSFGYIYDAQDINNKGVVQPILFTSDANTLNFYSPPIVSAFGHPFGTSFWEAFDAFTGNWLFNVTNVPGNGLPETMGPNGEHIRYIATEGADGTWYLAQWNSSRIWNWSNFGFPNVNAALGAVDASDRSMFDWNITLPSTIPSDFQEIAAFAGNMILCENGTMPILSTGESFAEISSSAPYTYFAINLNSTKGAVGSVLWWNTLDAPPGNVTVLLGPADPSTGVFTEAYMETRQWVGYSLYTGQKLWGPTASQAPLDYFGNPITPDVQGQFAYGNLYSMGYSGILYCYNAMSGNLKWTYGNGGEGNSTRATDTPFGDYPTFINAVGDGVIYTVTSEHTVNTPIYKGALTRAINASNGEEIWTLSDYTGEFAAMSYAIADGYATFFNGYDGQIYSVGKGPSATTANAELFGSAVVISGTVMDVSVGTAQPEQAADFPHGVPCTSDASMSQWMSYVYQQQPKPTNFTGVPVEISVLDSNRNNRVIGTTTTNANGFYSLTWIPDIPGNFTVTATFTGTQSYYGSSANTAFFAGPAAATVAPTVTPLSGLASNNTLMYGLIAIAVLIIVGIGALAMIILRKRS